MANRGGMRTGLRKIAQAHGFPSLSKLYRHSFPLPGAQSFAGSPSCVSIRQPVRAMNSTTAAPAHEPAHDEAEPPAWMRKIKANFCRVCGSPLSLSKPGGDKEWRHVCGGCGYVDYHNPKMVVGCVVEHQGKILLCRRAIEPCRGLWTLPAGFMELHESTAAGAARETWEEAKAVVQVIAPYAHWDIPLIGQAYILFRAQLAAPYTFSAGPESLEVALFSPHELPFDQLAFSSVAVTLRLYCEDMRAGAFRLHHGVIDKRPGSNPNEPGAFQLRDHVALELAAPCGHHKDWEPAGSAPCAGEPELARSEELT